MLLDLLALSIASGTTALSATERATSPVVERGDREASRVRRGVTRLGKRHFESSPGSHGHDFVGEPRWLIGWTEAPKGYAILDGHLEKTYRAPKLFKLWGYTYGGSGNNFGMADMRDRSPIGAGQIRTSGADDGIAFGAGRVDRATNKHQHAVPFEATHMHGIPDTAHSGGANRATGGFNAIQTIATQVNGTHNHTGTTGANGGHNHGGFVTEFVIGANPSIGGIYVVRLQ